MTPLTPKPRETSIPSWCPSLVSLRSSSGYKSQLGGRDAGSCCFPAEPERSSGASEHPLPVRAPGEEQHPGCSRLRDDGMQQLICTNGPRKAGSALQRRTHSSNNLNSSAFPSKKSLRMEERPYSGISPPTCTETWLGMLENSCPGREKHRICNVAAALGRSWSTAGCPALLSVPARTD